MISEIIERELTRNLASISPLERSLNPPARMGLRQPLITELPAHVAAREPLEQRTDSPYECGTRPMCQYRPFRQDPLGQRFDRNNVVIAGLRSHNLRNEKLQQVLIRALVIDRRRAGGRPP
jgi:hypothetical protein